ncbi:hypothetical protein [Jidongwangia harbinensis]|uniref:hypothetical protein n=1 Tax=Jidongwangia harbinensis TaxID=2878561 RepID=UPI001CD99007|nr:hypothetical protein [Jidongwangia harbinensis]MCA2217349.1 hypothetical protein [Jidongwangia harbinensis]
MTLLLPGARPADQPWLVYEDATLRDQPALHVLIAGVSAYPHLPGFGAPPTEAGLGMRQLSSTALSAYLMLDWLLRAAAEQRLCRPLGSVRMLLSPQVAEADATEQPAGRFVAPPVDELLLPGCTLPAFVAAAAAWRDSAKRHPDGATLFYFAGHGIQRTRGDQVLLMEEFGRGGPLALQAVDVGTLRNGMAPYAGDGHSSSARPGIARTQFYFVDACRNTPSRVLSLEDLRATPVFDVERSDLIDDRQAPVFYASIPAGVAQAVPGQQTLFSIALLRCLGGDAAEAPDHSAEGRRAAQWHVSSFSLQKGLAMRMTEVNRQYGGQQAIIADGFTGNAVLCYLPDRPVVPFEVLIEPDQAVPCTRIVVRDDRDPATAREIPAAGARFAVPTPPLRAGYYHFSAVVQPPTPPYQDCPGEPYLVEPLRPRVWKARMSA